MLEQIKRNRNGLMFSYDKSEHGKFLTVYILKQNAMEYIKQFGFSEKVFDGKMLFNDAEQFSFYVGEELKNVNPEILDEIHNYFFNEKGLELLESGNIIDVELPFINNSNSYFIGHAKVEMIEKILDFRNF